MNRLTSSLFILAGGKGERFWPLSRSHYPKQFLKLDQSGKSLIQHTYQRLAQLANVLKKKNIAVNKYIVTTERHVENLIEHLPNFKKDNIIIEPESRDTAAAIAWSTIIARQNNADQILAFFPADHYIEDLDTFYDDVTKAITVATYENRMVVLGIKPSFPATGYGYIEVGESLSLPNDLDKDKYNFYEVSRFVEKPDREKATFMLETGRYLWNSGILISRLDVLHREISQHAPDIIRPLECQRDHAYRSLPKISFDFAVLERSNSVIVRPSSFVWDDLGDWTALERLLKNEDGNVILAEHIGIDTEGIILYRTGAGLIVTVGVQNVIIVQDGDVTLVCHKDRVQHIKQVLSKLKENNKLEQYL